jgi:DNA-directed RNA polymerase subunit N (RpoN/RPB10)
MDHGDRGGYREDLPVKDGPPHVQYREDSVHCLSCGDEIPGVSSMYGPLAIKCVACGKHVGSRDIDEHSSHCASTSIWCVAFVPLL